MEELRRTTAEGADAEGNMEAGQTRQGMETSNERIRGEPVAGPSNAAQDRRDNNTRLNRSTGEMENLNTPVRTLTQKDNTKVSDDTMETPGDYISLSDESDQEINISGIQRSRNRINTRSITAKTNIKTKKKLYIDSEEEMMEGVGVDTPLLMTLNEMSANEVTAKAFTYAKIIEDIRTRSGRLQGSLSGRMKRALESMNDAITFG